MLFRMNCYLTIDSGRYNLWQTDILLSHSAFSGQMVVCAPDLMIHSNRRIIVYCIVGNSNLGSDFI